MSIKFVLRLVLALSFATIAVIFSELIPPLPGTNPFVARVFVTLLAASLGFVVFPDIASRITTTTFFILNFIISRLTSEFMSQFLRLSRQPHSPYISASPTVGGVSLQRPLILDTSAIIDGRILDIAKVGFVNGLVLIPNFILLELQQVSDSRDNLKRARGRRGFEVISELKKTTGLKVEVWDKDTAGKAVDEKLLKLAKSLNGKVVTTDFNLNNLAAAHGVNVLNVNDLSNALKTKALPGEKLETKIVHIGKDQKQGVGYLEDGTMIVVEDGADLLGKTIDVEVSRLLQGSAGRMIFAKKA